MDSPEDVYQDCAKRVIDVVGALIALVLFAPLMIATACLVWVTMGTPVLFRQPRPGKDGLPFTILKFRTMQPAADGLEGDEARLTRVGRVLRSLSLDELPELLNVVKGDMSLVGPRPLLMRYLGRYTPQQSRRHEVRPGITGWAQVNGRNALGWEERFRHDVWYVDNRSLVLDWQILCRTLAVLATRRGIEQPGQATAGEFKGHVTIDW